MLFFTTDMTYLFIIHELLFGQLTVACNGSQDLEYFLSISRLFEDIVKTSPGYNLSFRWFRSHVIKISPYLKLNQNCQVNLGIRYR